MPQLPTVPVALDSSAPADPTVLVRVIYFSITAEHPDLPMELTVSGVSFDFILLGLEGIILTPVAPETEFVSADEIDRLIDAIESPTSSQPHLFAFGTSSLWVPYEALLRSKKNAQSRDMAERGDVFRLSVEAFRKAWRFTDSQVDESALRGFFSDDASPNAPLVRYSPVETRAFREWAARQPGAQGSSSPP